MFGIPLKSKRLESAGKWLERHPVIAIILILCILLFLWLPDWGSSVWQLFTEKPFFVWLSEEIKKMQFSFSPYWVTIPISILAFLFVVYLLLAGRRKVQTNESQSYEAPPATEMAAPKVEELTEELRLATSARDALEKSRQHTSDLYEGARKEIERLKRDMETLSMSLNSRIEELERHKWIIELAQRNKEEIRHFVLVTHCSINLQYLDNIDPYLVFTFSVFNASVYPVSFEPNVGGHVTFDNHPLGGKKELTSNLKVFPYGANSYIKVTQFLNSDRAAKSIKDAAEAKRGMFKLDKLVIKFYGKDIEPAELIMPEGVYITGILYP